MDTDDPSDMNFAQSEDLRIDNERQMAFNRMAITTILFGATLLFGQGDDHIGLAFMSSVYLVYLASALILFVHIKFWPNTRVWRRIIGMSVDINALTYVSYIVGPVLVGLLYPGYLLIIYGYGFRYGVRWLVSSAAMAIVGVMFVVRESPLWQEHDVLAGGLIVGLVIIPAYAVKLVRNLWQAKAKAEESSRAKSMFIAAVSHDLRTPLNAIIGLGDILATSNLPREETDMARLIGESGRTLLGQINSILDFSRLEMGRDSIKLQTVDLHALLYNLRELLDVSAQAKGVALLLRVDMPVPRFVRTSERHIRDSLVNLVGNAIKFTPAGYVEIVLKATETRSNSTRLRFEVRDSGIGMGPDEQSRIFKRFTQANPEIRETYGGTGLGLAIAKQLVASLGGEIGVVSAKNVGSTFWFEIDAARADSVEPSPTPQVIAELESDDPALIQMVGAASVSAQGPATGEDDRAIVVLDFAARSRAGWGAALRDVGRRGLVVAAGASDDIDLSERAGGCSVVLRRPIDPQMMSDALVLARGPDEPPASRAPVARSGRELAILVAEDNKTNQKVIAKMLSLSGRKATLVSDGQAALDALANTRFDVVLMDINMPKIDGVEATRRLRMFERALDRRTPVIALTADVTDETRARCMAVGIDDCITKPVDWPTLERALDRLTQDSAGVEVVAASDGVATVSDEPASPSDDRSRVNDGEQQDGRLNLAALADLERLGGADFVREVALQFVADAAVLLKDIAVAVRERDVDRFRDEAHALRSCSANVGARSIYELCLSWREIGAEEFGAYGAEYLARLEGEYEKARRQLQPYIAEAA